MALSGDALTGLDQLKAYLSKTGSGDDALLEGLIEAVSAQFNSYTGRLLRARGYSADASDESYNPDAAVLDGSGHPELVLPQYPIQSVASLSLDGAAVDASRIQIDRQAGMIRLAEGAFTAGSGNVLLAYRAGYEVIPADLAQAALEQTVARWQQSYGGQGRLGISGRTTADGTVSYHDGALLPQVRAVLERYKNRSVL